MPRSLPPREVYDLARQAGLDHASAVIAVAIAWGESGLNPDAIGDLGLQDDTWGPSTGLWQVRSLKVHKGTGKMRDADRLLDPAFNAGAMVLISNYGANWRPWTIYRSGAYVEHLDAVRQAVEEKPMTDVVGGPVLDHVQAFANEAKRGTPHLGQIGTYEGHSPTRNRALDIFASSEVGDRLCDFALANWDRFGLWYVIWKQHIYNPSISTSWRLMSDRGSITQNHYDHVHLSFLATGSATPEEDFLAALTPDEQQELLDIARQSRDREQYANAVLGELKSQLCEAVDTDNWHDVGKKLKAKLDRIK